jgi:DNA-binding MarR family transcriptional regulator
VSVPPRVDGDRRTTAPDARVSQPELHEGTRLLRLIGQAYRQSRRRIEQVVREHGITLAQFGILYSLAEQPDLSGIEVADRAFITPQAAHAALTTLQMKALVERTEESAAQRRMVRTRLTDEGARVLTTCLHQLSDAGEDVGNGLTAHQRHTLTCLLAELVDSTSRPSPSVFEGSQHV